MMSTSATSSSADRRTIVIRKPTRWRVASRSWPGSSRAIRPQAIVALGRFAIHTLLQTKVPIGRLRGTWQQYHGLPLMPTYHPAYLLRNPIGKREVWADMKQVMQLLNQ